MQELYLQHPAGAHYASMGAMHGRDSSETQLTLVTFNCMGLPFTLPGMRQRLRVAGAALASSSADIACLQEVGRWRYLPLLHHDDGRWPFVAAAEHSYAPKGGLATLARVPILAQEYQRFEARGSAASLHATERYQNKGMLFTTLMLAGQAVVVINTHLAANYNADWRYTNPYAKVERAQLREVVAAVSAIPSHTLVVVAGDFNVPRHSWLYKELCNLAGLLDPLAASHEPTYRPLPGIPARAAQALDHILVRVPPVLSPTFDAALCFGEPVLLQRSTMGYLSDHIGVRLRITW
jgi:endonuclease/exonuclease/phosphatase family metal-dependent hydrolase